ncbi:MAG: beta-N-acetylhexosaminidase [Nevskia sp.]|nr:beta-N-acetylhexosaminidase [Nevskia sp.]
MSSIGPLMGDIGGLEVSAEDREVLAHPLVGGVILFARNYSEPEQLRRLCADLATIKPKQRLLLAVDHEGGRVQRFRVGFSRIPAMGTIGKLHVESALRAKAEAQAQGLLIGQELASYGIDLCFAPVLDLDHGISKIIGDRAFAADPQIVIALARAFREGLNAAGLAATGKHFPGHGGVAADSHVDLPIDRRPLAEIEGKDLLPFRALIEDGIESLMLAHVRYSAVDDKPASFSRAWVRGVLRGQLKYNGAVFADDLSMAGAAVIGDIVERAQVALDADCDMLPVCNDRGALTTLLAQLKVPARRALPSARLENLYRREVAGRVLA